MVYFKFELAFRWFGNKKNSPNGVRTEKRQKATWDFLHQEIEQAKAKGKFKTAANYQTAVNSFVRFKEGRVWCLSDFNPDEMALFQQWLAAQGICQNTISCYMRQLRTLYNRAVKQGLITDNKPFAEVFTGKDSTCKRSVMEEDILKLSRLSLTEGSRLAFARDIFLFSFYAMGMPFVDIAFLQKSQVSETTIHYARHKTGQEITVALEPCMQNIMNRYASDSSKYVFPIITSQIPVETHRQYQAHLRNYNNQLARLSRMIGASRKLSSYVVRHTWASMAYKHNMDLGLISRALGHTKTSTTFIYIRELFCPELGEANRKLLKDFT